MDMRILHTLDPATDGWAVRGALTELDGRLYGLAGECGPNGVPGCSSTASWPTLTHTRQCPGSLFSIRLDGSDFRVEHAFSRLDDAGQNADGYHPYGTLAVGPDRLLYGVAQFGGVPVGAAPESPPGFGVLFAYDPASGVLETLHSFFGLPRAADGEHPMGALAVDAAGSVYGTCKGSGRPDAGTVWRWSPGAPFLAAQLPGECYGGVTLAGGVLHGATSGPGAGVYFVADPATLRVRVVGEFPDYPAPQHADDNTPIQEPTALSDGSVVVPREFGGMYGTGLIAKLSPTSGIAVLREMADLGPVDVAPRFANPTGAMPNGRIVEGRDGLLYGCALYGGASGTGCVWRAARDGSLWQVIYSWPDGAYPYGGPTVGSDGALYGVSFGTGQIWRLDPASVSL